MISSIFQTILVLSLVPILLVLQVINMVITISQYCFIHKKYRGIQELFDENSEYIDRALKI